MDIALWVVQVLLAALFLATGIVKLVRTDQRAAHLQLPKPVVRLIGVAEILGAAGLILPVWTGILPILTPLAAIGLGVTMLLAIAFNYRLQRHAELASNIVLLALVVVVVFGRWTA